MMACGTSSGTGSDAGPAAHDAGRDGAATDASRVADSGRGDTFVDLDVGTRVDAGPCGSCPAGYKCSTANSMPVCRAPSGIPLFSNVFVILMENTTLSSLADAISAGDAPNLKSFTATYATGSNYHGITHPSLPNYIALTSGGTQGISCDCDAEPGQGTCGSVTCNLLLSSCSCANSAVNIADQLEAAGLSWMDFGEDMGTPCNLTDSGNYAVRHNPFLYYNQIQTSPRCDAHVVDYKSFDPSNPPDFTYIAPNLVDDMHNPLLTTPPNSPNIPNGDKWIGPNVQALLSSAAYKKGGLIVVVWDEDDNSGGISDSDDPIPIFIMSPFAKSGGYVSATKADHYSLLATFEDGLGVGRIGMAAGATPLVDYFPAK
jgi:phosphatidylinositol-3-phosphatase